MRVCGFGSLLHVTDDASRILNTAEYCLQTSKPLEEKLKSKASEAGKADDPAKAPISFSDEQDLFLNVHMYCLLCTF